MGSRVFYTTRERVMDAFDVKEAAHRSSQVDQAIAAASDDVDGWLKRHKHGLAPTTATRYFSWPSGNYAPAWRLWLDENELVSVTSLVSGGQSLTENTHFFLEPVNSGPPYTHIEINLNSTASFSNSGTRQRAIAVTGVFGINNDQQPGGALSEALDASETAVDVTDSSLIGVGSVLTVDSERMLVTGKTALDTTQNLQGNLDDLDSDRTVLVTDGTLFHVGETILIDSERMKIVDIAGNTLTVIRAYDGSVLATHDIADDIFAYRTLTVERGALGTTAATHLTAATVTVWDVPDLVEQLTRATAITSLEQEWSAYGARVFSDEAERDSSGTEVVSGRGLTDVRRQCVRRYGRKFRKAAI